MKAVNERLTQWASTCLAETKRETSISSDLAERVEKPNVCLWLNDILAAPPKSVGRIAPLQVRLRYHIFVQAKQRSEASEILEELLFAAMSDASIDLDLKPIESIFWQTMGCRPCPGFYIVVEHQQESEVSLAKPVAEPLHMRINPTSRLHGSVMIQLKNNMVIPGHGAKVNLANSHISALVDDKGRFTLGAIPPMPKKKLLLVQYKSYSQKLSVSASESPLEITLETQEN